MNRNAKLYKTLGFILYIYYILFSGGYGKAVDIWSIGCILGELSDGQPVFPGESEIDQLYVIQKLVGPLPPSQMHLFNINHRFRGLKFPAINNPLTLKTRYSGILSSDLVEFMEWVLTLEPDKRPIIDQCVAHYAFLEGSTKNKDLNLKDSTSSIEEDLKNDWPAVELSSAKQPFVDKTLNDNEKAVKFDKPKNSKQSDSQAMYGYTSKNSAMDTNDIDYSSNPLDKAAFQYKEHKKSLPMWNDKIVYKGVKPSSDSKATEKVQKIKTSKAKSTLVSSNFVQSSLNSVSSQITLKDEWSNSNVVMKGMTYSRHHNNKESIKVSF